MNEESVAVPIGYQYLPSLSLFACEPPELLYHYTDCDGANGIVTSKSIRLTALRYLNDTSELRLAIKLFQDVASKTAENLGDKEKSDFLKRAGQQLDSFTETIALST